MTDERTEEVKETIETKVNYVINAFGQRKEALTSASNQTSNPLDRLLIQAKVEEIDLFVSHLKAILK